jgi:hypothetical protein
MSCGGVVLVGSPAKARREAGNVQLSRRMIDGSTVLVPLTGPLPGGEADLGRSPPLAPDLDAQLAAAQAKLNSARAVVKVREAEQRFTESTYQRWRDSPKGVVSVQEQQSKEAHYNSAKARLNSAIAEVAADQGDVDRLQAMANFRNIIVPFDGVVTARETDVGALINAGSGAGGGNGPELFRVADIHMMRVYVQVPQQLSANIKAGLNAELHLPQYPDKTFKATVATTSSATPRRWSEYNAVRINGMLGPIGQRKWLHRSQRRWCLELYNGCGCSGRS